MNYLLYSSEKHCKAHSGEALYCCPPDWWKHTDQPVRRENASSRYIERQRYRIARKGKLWSIVWLSSGLQRLTKEENSCAELAEEFHKLVKQWNAATSFHSSLGEIFTDESYQRIMAMGRDALPMILSELQKKPGHWFYALEKIVGKDVAEGAKSFAEARAAWLNWGYSNNYI
jgi:hypothetical protein